MSGNEENVKNNVRDTNTETLRLKIKRYLELDNVSVLAGAGTSFHLGAPIIRTVPDDLAKSCSRVIERYFGAGAKPSYEDLFNCLQAHLFLSQKKGRADSTNVALMRKMQKWLFDKCDTEKCDISASYKDDVNLKTNRYFYHEMLVKKLLQRPNNLSRVNLFTTNYDMAFDYALDNLGVFYINGFHGIHNRCFRPEVYDYDLYYPGQSVSGKVHRAEKVLRYYKLHGSLSWIAEAPSPTNTYGISEMPLNENFEFKVGTQLMIYPCVSKKTFTLDLPYSELFRRFADAINKPQSVLICLGYSFYDEHINDIIYQALSNPSFTLFIVNYSPEPDPDSEIARLQRLGDKRILILDQSNYSQSTFVGFVKNILPDLYEISDEERIAETRNLLFSSGKEADNAR